MSNNGIDAPLDTATDPGTNTATDTATNTGIPEQLSLLGTPNVPLQFRLDERTRRNGLQHVAELRALMLAQAANRQGTGRRSAQRPAARHQIAA